MSAAIDWEQDTKRLAVEARVREILEPQNDAARALFRQCAREGRQRQADEENRRMDSVFYAGLWISIAGTLVLFLGSLLWG